MDRALRSTGWGSRQRAPRQSQHRAWGLDLDRLRVKGLKSGPSRHLEGLRHQSLLVIRLEVPPKQISVWVLPGQVGPGRAGSAQQFSPPGPSAHLGPAPTWAGLEQRVFHRLISLVSDSRGFFILNLEVRSCESSIFSCLFHDGFRQPRSFTYLYKI